jgi:hypothetical protein
VTSYSKTSRRFLLGISIIWLVLALFATAEQTYLKNFLLFGLLPVLAFWMARWIWLGYRKEKAELTRPRWFRRRSGK